VSMSRQERHKRAWWEAAHRPRSEELLGPCGALCPTSTGIWVLRFLLRPSSSWQLFIGSFLIPSWEYLHSLGPKLLLQGTSPSSSLPVSPHAISKPCDSQKDSGSWNPCWAPSAGPTCLFWHDFPLQASFLSSASFIKLPWHLSHPYCNVLTY
jgi:hypothetical protein